MRFQPEFRYCMQNTLVNGWLAVRGKDDTPGICPTHLGNLTLILWFNGNRFFGEFESSCLSRWILYYWNMKQNLFIYCISCYFSSTASCTAPNPWRGIQTWLLIFWLMVRNFLWNLPLIKNQDVPWDLSDRLRIFSFYPSSYSHFMPFFPQPTHLSE